MTGTQIFIVAVAAIAVLLAVAIFVVAARSRPGGEKPEVGSLDRAARRKDAAREKERALVGAVVGANAEAPVEIEDEPVPVDPLAEREVVEPEEYDVTRRQFFNRGILAVFGIFLAQFGLASLAFMWPKLKAGGFGSKVNAGNVADILAAVTTPDGRVLPLFVPAAKSYVMPFRGNASGSSFEGLPVIAGDLVALWQRCVHLGCRVPYCGASQGFECPCHGSKYNNHGEYEDGPAPRNLDRFVVSVNEANELIIDTGQVIQTARSTQKTVEYPQGPSCI